MNKNFYMLSDDELEKLFRVSKMTMTDYELIGNIIPVESLMSIIEDLLVEVGKLEEKIEDIEKDRDENYKPISYAEQIGYNEREFY